MLTTIPLSDTFDLSPWVGQRSATFTFRLINGATGENRGLIHPERDAKLTHDVTRTVKRQLTLNLGQVDTSTINPLSDYVEVSMVAGGVTYPLGRYGFTDETLTVITSGDVSNVVLNDQMFQVDQPIISGIDAVGLSVVEAYELILRDLHIDLVGEASPFLMSQSWAIGASRGQMLDALAVAGDYFSPWFGNDQKLHLIRSFNPAMAVPQFDYDAGNQVFRDGITRSSNILTSPNRFVVISNTNANALPVTASAVVPPGAPNSFANRGFYITNVQTLQLTSLNQAEAVVNGLANRQTVFETVSLSTPPDPRHDAYDVIHWQGELWLELAWTMNLFEGGAMTHTMRRGYTP